MMAKIVSCTEDTVNAVQDIIGYVEQIFKDKPVIIYSVMDDKGLGFIVRDGDNCVYLKREAEGYGLAPFRLRKDGSLDMLLLGEDKLYFPEEDRDIEKGKAPFYIMVDKNGVEHLLGINKYRGLDDDGYDAAVCYTQYNRQNDVICDMRFQQMYRIVDGRVPIYPMHIKQMDVIAIDEHYSKRGNDHIGFLGPSSKYFKRYTFGMDELGYRVLAIKDYGLIESKQAYALQRYNKETRYVKSFFVRKDRSFVDLWPFVGQRTSEEIKHLITSYGFNAEIPQKLLDFYNGHIDICNSIEDLVKQMAELDKSNEQDKCMIMELTFHED